MAAINVTAQLTETDIKRAAQNTEKVFRAAFDNINVYARETAKRFADALGAGNLNQALSRLQQIRTAFQAREQAAESAHQRKLVEFRERTAFAQATIAQRSAAQLDAIRARQEANELRHQQKLTEIAARGQQGGGGSSFVGGLLGGFTGAALFSTCRLIKAVKRSSR
jgi:hypothetical protein